MLWYCIDLQRWGQANGIFFLTRFRDLVVELSVCRMWTHRRCRSRRAPAWRLRVATGGCRPGLPSGWGSLYFCTGRGSACIPDHLPGPSPSPKSGPPSYEDEALRPVDVLDCSSVLRPSGVLFQSYLVCSMAVFNVSLLYAKRYFENDCWFVVGFGIRCCFGVWILFVVLLC